MAKDLDARFRNVHAFAHALLPFASSEGRLLIERIGQITQAAKTRKQGAGAAGRSTQGSPAYPEPGRSPVPPATAGRLRQEGSVTRIKGSAFTPSEPTPPPAGGSGQVAPLGQPPANPTAAMALNGAGVASAPPRIGEREPAGPCHVGPGAEP